MSEWRVEVYGGDGGWGVRLHAPSCVYPLDTYRVLSKGEAKDLARRLASRVGTEGWIDFTPGWRPTVREPRPRTGPRLPVHRVVETRTKT